MNTPQPNNNVDPYSMKPAVQNPSEVDRGSGSVRRRKIWPLLLIIFSALGLLAGVLMGVIYFSQCARVYQSKATIAISPRQKNAYTGHDPQHGPWQFSIRHDQLIVQDNILTMCLIKYGLRELETLRDFPDTDQIKEIQDNFVVSQNPDEPTQYLLEYSSLNPRDAQTVLATIVATYEKHLDEKYRSITADTMELLKKMSDKFHKELKAVDERLKAARERVETLGDAESLEGGEGVLAQVTKKLDAEEMDRKKSLLFELEADLRRSEEALEEGRDACMEFIWNREDDTRTSPFEYGDKEPSSEEAKVSEDSPEEVMRRFIVSTKQQIRGVRSSLKTDLAAYNENYEMMVEVEKAGEEVRDLLLLKEKFLKQAGLADQKIIEEQNTISTRLRHGFIFETTQPACLGVEVRPMLSVILPVAGLVGASLGLVMGCLVVLVFRGS